MVKPHISIEWTPTALSALREVGSRSTQQKIVDKIASLLRTNEPEQLGKPLQDELQSIFRLSYARYRILYRVVRKVHGGVTVIAIVIQVVLVGIRRDGDKHDVYRIAQKLRRQGKL